jgi:hypothetical protein
VRSGILRREALRSSVDAVARGRYAEVGRRVTTRCPTLALPTCPASCGAFSFLWTTPEARDSILVGIRSLAVP